MVEMVRGEGYLENVISIFVIKGKKIIRLQIKSIKPTSWSS